MVGKHQALSTPVPVADRRRNVGRSRTRSRRSLPLTLLGSAAAIGFIAVNVVDPYSGATASPYFQIVPRYEQTEVQSLALSGAYDTTFTRDVYDSEAAPPPPPPPPPPVVEEEEDDEDSGSGFVAPSAAVPDPGTAQAIAYDKVAARGWGEDQYSCLVALWNKESGWRVNAHNTSSGAYGIPQSLPGSKMASAGADWATNPATQIEWGLGYISGRYGTPCGAWGHSQSVGWY
ncbi:lytic transglycosylase domain-containing protein [Labedella endophytica]|uniref:Lytic transglycosylase domain-containing protein n=1 Tax=Labedella endophytica TaxID=1523160 RepID=A0A433JNQ2_9MICO|nr:lytic transglycosylase domain-containing protein [Labedella endophytica]